MALASDRDTYVYRKGVTPNTVSEISSKTRIYATPASDSDNASGVKKQIGVVAQFDPSESRSIEPIRGIGFGDQIAELVPGVTEPMSLSVVRTAQYLASIYQVFGYKGGIDGLVRSLKHHRWPFDIIKESIFSQYVSDNYTGSNTGSPATADGTDPESTMQAISTTFEGCWFSEWSTSYTSDTSLVQENCTMMVSDVYSSDAGWGAAIESPDTGNSAASARITGT
jgi:hypothetical protein